MLHPSRFDADEKIEVPQLSCILLPICKLEVNALVGEFCADFCRRWLLELIFAIEERLELAECFPFCDLLIPDEENLIPLLRRCGYHSSRLLQGRTKGPSRKGTLIIEELVVEKERQIELIGLNVEDALLVLELMAPDEVNGELNGLAIEQHKSCNGCLFAGICELERMLGGADH